VEGHADGWQGSVRWGPARQSGGLRIGRGGQRGGRRKRCRHRHGRRGRQCAELVYYFLVFCVIEDTAEEDVFPPEGQKEGRIVFIYLAGILGGVIYGGEASGVVGDRRAVRGKRIELVAAGVFHFFAIPVRSAGGAESEDKRDTGPEVVNQGAGYLMIAV
jgi:hypothetical protein